MHEIQDQVHENKYRITTIKVLYAGVEREKK